jgi:VWFA-related protein
MHRRFLFLALCAPVAFGQTFLPVPQPDQSLFHTSANLAQIDALVTDSEGRPVRNLTAADFEVLRQGEPQKILAASYVQQERTVVLVVDDLGLSLEGIGRVRAALLKFVEEQMRPGDRAAVVRTGTGTGALQALTGDKEVLRAAIGLVQCYPARVAAGVVASAGDQARHSRFSAGSRGAVRFAIDGLRHVPGRKAVVLFTENADLFNNAVEPLAHLVDLANQAAAVVYVAGPPDAAALAVLAEQTGGALLANIAGISDGLAQVLREQDGYYLIGWQLTGFPMGWDNQKPIVKTTREGLTVRSRTGFLGITEFEAENAQPTRRQELLQVLGTPFSQAGIGVRLTALFSDSPGRGSYVEALLHLDAKGLSHIHSLDRFHQFALDIVIQLYDENGRADRESDRSFYMTLTESAFRQTLSGGLGYSLTVPVRRPGAYQVRAIVGDAISGNIGYASQFLDVPDVAGDQLVLSGIVLMGERFKDPLAAEGGVQLDAVNESPAVRVFKPGQTISYAYRLFNPSIGDDKKPAVEARTRLFREGRLAVDGNPVLPRMPAGGDLKRYDIAGKISLAPEMEPGDYVIYVTVTDKLARKQPRQATQSIDFRIE